MIIFIDSTSEFHVLFMNDILKQIMLYGKLFLYTNFDFLFQQKSILKNSKLEANLIVFWIQLILSFQLSIFVFFIQVFSCFRLFNYLISKSNIWKFYIKRWLHNNWFVIIDLKLMLMLMFWYAFCCKKSQCDCRNINSKKQHKNWIF